MNFPKAKARRVPGEMNKQEAEFYGLLQARLANDEIIWCEFEPITLRLAPRTTYTPDFLVITSNLRIVFYEVKGFFTGRHQHSRIKLKAAAEKFPWMEFIMVSKKPKKEGGGWVYETIKPSPTTSCGTLVTMPNAA